MFNIFKNSFHYWFLGGANIAYFVYHPKYTQAFSDDTVNIFAGVALLCMLGNFYCHYILMNLRPSGTTARGIPQGFLFNFVSCPNYFLEIIEWIAFAIMTQALTSYLFALVSAGQMWIWAVDKHKRYKKEFDGTKGTQKYPKRKILIPFVL
jgi:very-long-chain enoyl-CoA reductase